jgi:uncharacterized protein YggE
MTRRAQLIALPLAVALVALVAWAASGRTPRSRPLIATPAAATGTAAPKITVRGVGRVTGTPDLLTVVLGVETRSARAADALEDNSHRAAALIDLLKQRGVEKRDVQTSQLSVNPQYDERGRVVTGYVVSNLVTAKLRDLDHAGELIDAAAKAAGDAIRVHGFGFSIDDTSTLVAAARKQAVTRAKEQAQQLADAAGVGLGPVRSISETRNLPTPDYAIAAGAAGADNASVPIERGSQELTVDVDVVYEIAS